MIVFLTKDLMIQSKATAAARPSGATVKAVGRLEAAMKAIGADSNPLLLVDLQMPGLDLDAFASAFADLDNPCRAIALAQHVETELLAKAQSCGFEAVMTRGQFSNELVNIIGQHVS